MAHTHTGFAALVAALAAPFCVTLLAAPSLALGDGTGPSASASASGSAPAPSSSSSTSLNKARLDLSVPDIPAFTALGVSPSTISRPTNLKDLAAALSNGVNTSGAIQSGLAVEVAPLKFFPPPSPQGNGVHEPGMTDAVLGGLAFSVGTNVTGTSPSVTSSLAYGARWVLGGYEPATDTEGLGACLSAMLPLSAPGIQQGFDTAPPPDDGVPPLTGTPPKATTVAPAIVDVQGLGDCRALFRAAHLASTAFEAAYAHVDQASGSTSLSDIHPNDDVGWASLSIAPKALRTFTDDDVSVPALARAYGDGVVADQRSDAEAKEAAAADAKKKAEQAHAPADAADHASQRAAQAQANAASASAAAADAKQKAEQARAAVNAAAGAGAAAVAAASKAAADADAALLAPMIAAAVAQHAADEATAAAATAKKAADDVKDAVAKLDQAAATAQKEADDAKAALPDVERAIASCKTAACDSLTNDQRRALWKKAVAAKPGNNAMAFAPLLFGRVDSKRIVLTSVPRQTQLQLSARLPLIADGWSFFFEGGYKFTDLGGDVTPAPKNSLPLGLGGDVRLGDGTWLGLYAGYDALNGSLLSVGNLKWSFGEKSRPYSY
jgi:hypothetical protein